MPPSRHTLLNGFEWKAYFIHLGFANLSFLLACYDGLSCPFPPIHDRIFSIQEFAGIGTLEFYINDGDSDQGFENVHVLIESSTDSGPTLDVLLTDVITPVDGFIKVESSSFRLIIIKKSSDVEE